MEGASSSIIMLVVLIAVFYFMLIRPENKRKKKAQEMRDSLKKGDTITDAFLGAEFKGGIFAERFNLIAAIEDEELAASRG